MREDEEEEDGNAGGEGVENNATTKESRVVTQTVEIEVLHRLLLMNTSSASAARYIEVMIFLNHRLLETRKGELREVKIAERAREFLLHQQRLLEMSERRQVETEKKKKKESRDKLKQKVAQSQEKDQSATTGAEVTSTGEKEENPQEESSLTKTLPQEKEKKPAIPNNNSMRESRLSKSLSPSSEGVRRKRSQRVVSSRRSGASFEPGVVRSRSKPINLDFNTASSTSLTNRQRSKPIHGPAESGSTVLVTNSITVERALKDSKSLGTNSKELSKDKPSGRLFKSVAKSVKNMVAISKTLKSENKELEGNY